MFSEGYKQRLSQASGLMQEVFSEVTNGTDHDADGTIKEASNQGASAATKFVKSLDALEKRVHAYPGRRIFGRFVHHLQERHQLHLRTDDILAVLDRSTAPRELIQCIDSLAQI